MKTSSVIIFLFFIGCFIQIANAQKSLKFERYNIDNGLINNNITAIIQDSKGFLWIGTEDGLHRYDGYEFEKFVYNATDSLSLSHNNIYTLFIDSSNRMWIGTLGGGINMYDFSTNTFVNLRNKPEHFNKLKNTHIRAICEDKDKNIWIGGYNGIEKFNYTKKTFSHIASHHNKKNNLTSAYIWGMVCDDNNSVWVATMRGLNKIDAENNKVVAYFDIVDTANGLLNQNTWSIASLRDSLLLIGTPDGLSIFNTKNEIFTNYTHEIDNTKSLGGNDVFAFCPRPSGNFWVGMLDSGLDFFDAQKKHFTHYVHNKYNTTSLSCNSVKSIYTDRSGILWVGTLYGGLNKLNLANHKFDHFRTNILDNNSLNNDIVKTIYEDKDGNIWIGTWGGGVNYYKTKEDLFYHFSYDENNKESFPDDFVHSLFVDSQGLVWVGTRKGLVEFDPNTKKSILYPKGVNNSNATLDGYIHAFFEDKNGNILIGCETGLNVLNKETRKFVKYFNHRESSNLFSSCDIRAIHKDSNDVFWLGTYNGGLNKIIFKKNGITVVSTTFYRHAFGDSTTISNDNVWCIHQAKDGFLWLGTSDGLNRFDMKNEKFTHFTTKDGLPGNVIYGILSDDNENLWISTNTGLAKFNTNTNSIIKYSEKDGLQSIQFNDGAHHKGNSGFMYFGGINGFNRFEPKQIKNSQYVPPIYISDLKINNKSVTVGTQNGRQILTKTIEETDFIELSYFDKVITFEFVSLHFTNSDKVKYAYTLNGFDKTWTVVDEKRRSATYTNLDPGEYSFTVKGTNSDGIWNEQAHTIKIRIIPPFWLEKWFIICITLLITSIIYLYIRHTVSLVRNRNIQLENIVKQRSAKIEKQKSELEDTYLRMKKLVEIGNEISQLLDIRKINEVVYKHLSQLLEVTSFSIGIYNPEKNQLEFNGAIEDMKILPPYEIPDYCHEKSLAVWCLKNETEILIGEFTKVYHRYIPLYLRPDYITVAESVIYVPLKVKDSCLGVMSVQNTKPNTYKSTDVDIIRNIAVNVAIAVDNATAYNKIEKQTDNLRLYNQKLQDSQIEIKNQAEELNLQAEELKKSNQEIIHKNIELEKHRTELEKLVEARTHDLIIAKEKAEQSDKLKTAFLSNMSHEIRTPLNAIVGFTALITSSKLTEIEKTECYKFIESNSNSLLQLIDDIIDIAKIEAGDVTIRKTLFKVNELIDTVHAKFQLEIKAKNEVDLHINYGGANNLAILSDSVRIQQILSSMISNSIKYTEKGFIEIGYKMNIDKSNKTPEIEFYVKDTGVGIPMDKQAFVFESFRKIEMNKNKIYRGAGLGLALAKSLVNILGGDIKVESTIGVGSTFSFVMPAIFVENFEQKLIEDSRSYQTFPLLNWQDKKILVADADPNLYKFIYVSLQVTRCKLIHATDGEQAVNLFMQNQDIALVLMNLNLPQIDGYQATSHIRSVAPVLPIIALTSQKSNSEKEKSVLAGCTDFLAKPFATNDLIKTLMRYL